VVFVVSVSEATLKALKELGFTEYEIHAYVTLVDGGQMAASEISSKSGVPFSRIYDVLSRLEEKGFLQVQRGRPTRYVARAPTEVVRLIKLGWEKKLEDSSKAVLEELQPRFERETPATTRDVWLLHGRASILAKALEMVDGAKEEILLSLPSLNMDTATDDEYTEDLTAIVDSVLSKHKNAKAYVLTSSVPKALIDMIPPGIEIRCRPAFGAGLVVDRRETLIMLPSDDSKGGLLGVFSSAQVFANMASSYFDSLWKESSPV
jgi:sugar-specific transcriptional regulator TrmB